MGSNFEQLKPGPGITIQEKGKTKANNDIVEGGNPKKISKEQYYSMTQGVSLKAIAETKMQREDRSFSLP